MRLFKAWKGSDSEGVLRESADILEVLLKALDHCGWTLDDLLKERARRLTQGGGFSKGILLQDDRMRSASDLEVNTSPGFIFSPLNADGLLDLIKLELTHSESAWIASAFFSPAILNLLLRDFSMFVEQGKALRVLLSTMGNINRPEHLSHLQNSIPGIQVKVFHPREIPFDQAPPNFHPKIYLFRRFDGQGSLVIGSANFTEAGFRKNIEWSYFSSGEINLPFGELSPFEEALRVFNLYWHEMSVEVTDDFLAAYRKRFRLASPLRFLTGARDLDDSTAESLFEPQEGFVTSSKDRIQPNEPQKEALENLERFRTQGVRKAAIIAATGIGKTYLAALDFVQSRGRTLLFIAHRENLLHHARESFRRVLEDESFGDILGGGRDGLIPSSSVFAMIQTLSRSEHLERFSPQAFDYIVIDEFHHSEAYSYRKVLDHFNPGFFLGLTATPERMDGRDVLAFCDYNIAYELRLMEAVDRGWLAPFQYYAIYDSTNYDEITWRGTRYDDEELSRALENDTRTAIIATNLKKFLPSGPKIKCIAFCSSVSHARYTAKELSGTHGISSVALTGEDSESVRNSRIRSLQDDGHSLQIICTVDVFNEGIDIPDLTHVLFLRPTQSFTVFLQQLGRGLRLNQGKEFLVVIDLVGNFRRSHVAQLALRGYTSLEQFANDSAERKQLNSLPDACYLDVDIEVKRIWDEEIRRIVSGELTKDERLKALYLEIREDLDDVAPGLLDFVGNSHQIDPYVFIRHFGGWLRTRLYCDGFLNDTEQALLDTPAEEFLKHIEMDLKPVRSFKMVVLLTVLNLPGIEWAIKDIAKGFHHYYLAHPNRIGDYEELARFTDPEQFPLNRVIAKLKQMPLNFLSNKDSDFFILQRKTGTFRLKSGLAEYWNQGAFKSMVRERVEFGLIRYFARSSAEAEDFSTS